MEKVEFLSSIFDFFAMIMEYYKTLKKNKKGNFQVPSQIDIGAAFGGLSNNYTLYKKKKHLPNIWGK